MLEEYKKKYAKPIVQFIVLDTSGTVLESDNAFFNIPTNLNITEVHPFFETVAPLLSNTPNELDFTCIHLDFEGKHITSDIIIKTFSDKHPLLIIHDLTSHYTNYQTTAQVKNESVIDSQVLELKNTYLKEKETFKNLFIANFSHELRDPLTGILTFSEILTKTNLTPQQREYLKILNSSSDFLKKMIDDILDISKIEAGKLQLSIEPFYLIDLLDEIRYNYSIKAEEKGLDFYFDFDEKLPKIVGGDSKRLRQVLTNLLDNAVKFTTKGSIKFNVTLNQIRAQKANIHFEIIDTGIGLKESDYNEAFTSFSQVNNNEKFKGTGLGLAIVKYLVELTKSKITIESKLGKGSTFSTNINFKVNPSLKVAEAKKGAEITFNPPQKKYNVLLIEDSEIAQLSVLKILASTGHFFLDIVTNKEDAITRISNLDSEIDLVLLDIKLKQERGEDVAKAIRKMPERHQRKVPIIATTAKVFKEDLKLYKKAGISDVLFKPFNSKQLLTKISEHLK